jgi:O-antigen/teichoic acid export membrane protein
MNFIQQISVTDLKIFFTKGNERTLKAKKNIAASFIIKGASGAINLLLIPLTLHYLNPTKYGIWITLYSIIGWFIYFDMGLANGLRNKFAEAIAKGEKEKARIYISTTYGTLSIIVLIIFIVFFIANYFVDWTVILNAQAELKNELSTLAIIVFGFFCLSFVIQLIGTILTADQKPAIKNLFHLLSNLTALKIYFTY